MPKRLFCVKENNEARYKDYLEEADLDAAYTIYRENQGKPRQFSQILGV